MGKLSDRDEMMAHEYLKDYSAMAAAIRAGYAHSTAKNASEWVHPDHPKKPRLRQRIDELMARKSARLGVSRERIIDELAKVLFCQPEKLIDFETGKVREDAEPEDMAAIAGVKVKDGKFTEREVKLHDKLRAAELLGRHLGMFDDKARREEGEQSSVAKVADLMARLDAEAKQGALPLDPAQGTDSPENPAFASGGATGEGAAQPEGVADA